MKKKLLVLFGLITLSAIGQQNVFIDFGNTTTVTSGNWNNVIVTTQNQSNVVLNLNDSNGVNSGIVFTLTDSFDHINTNGTSSPNGALPFPASATQDSFFGETNAAFNGNVNPTGGFTLSGLNPSKYYSFSVFSSRTGVSDNRETLYTVTGATTGSQALNASNNTSTTADILNIQANASGEITFQAAPGPNNNNSNGFYYLGALQLLVTDTPVTSMSPAPSLTLTYPNGGHLWEVGKTVRIKWQSISIPNMQIEFSSDNGSSWATIATTAGSSQYYDMVVPNTISTNCLVRISGSGLSDTSDAVFEVIPNDGVVYRIVVLGSSTAAGTGPSDINNAWVWKYDTYLTEMDTRYDVINLALGGFATYNILPTGTPIPAGVNRTIDVARNITHAMTLDPDGIIINMPSNDAASGYPVADQIYNYSLISNVTTTANVPLWVTTPQPRNFGTNTTNLNIQLDMIPATYNAFGTNNTVDFWTGLVVANNNGILPQYDSGDGIHMNTAGHQILFDRIIGKGIHTTVKNNVDVLSITKAEDSIFAIYPNPAKELLTINNSFNHDKIKSISIFNFEGKEIKTINTELSENTIQLNISDLNRGIYFIKVKFSSKEITKKIILN